MSKSIYGLLIAALVITTVFAFAACSNSDQKTASAEKDPYESNKSMDHKDGMTGDMEDMDHGDSTENKETSANFSDQRNGQTSAIISAYDQTKKGLDANDRDKTAEGAKVLLAAFAKFDATKLPEDKRKEYAEIVESAKEHAEHIVKSEIPHQKEHFESLTKDLKDLFSLINTGARES